MALNFIRNINNKLTPSSSRVLLEEQEAIEPIQQQQARLNHRHVKVSTHQSQSSQQTKEKTDNTIWQYYVIAML